MEKIDYIIEMVRRIKEEGPTMAMGNGKIAGSVEAGDDPPVRKKKKYIYMKGTRKLWQQK
jgi:hypothetical protein|tara:strand:- start:2112 stop:2291 length:180 start_codon:yes stop_codon:yes gene_type:complete